MLPSSKILDSLDGTCAYRAFEAGLRYAGMQGFQLPAGIEYADRTRELAKALKLEVHEAGNSSTGNRPVFVSYKTTEGETTEEDTYHTVFMSDAGCILFDDKPVLYIILGWESLHIPFWKRIASRFRLKYNH